MKVLRRIFAWVAIAVAAVIILLLGLWGLVQTGPGKSLLASTIGSLASGNGLTLTIGGIEGSVPFSMTATDIRAADNKGVFASVDRAHLAWHPMRLLGGVLDIETLAAGKVSLTRLPELPPAPESSGSGLPAMRAILGNLSVDELALGAPVLGTPVTLSITGNARLVDPAEGLALAFAVERRDSPGAVKGTARYVPGTEQLDIDVAAGEPAGGVVARLIGLPGLPAVAASVKGSGTLDDWQGKLVLDAGDMLDLGGTAAIRAVEGGSRRVMLDLAGTVAGLAPENVRPALDGRSEMIGSAVIDPAGRIAIEGLNLKTAGVGLALVGTLDIRAGTGKLAFDIVGGDASRFAGLMPDLAWNSLRLHAEVDGKLAAPTVDATLTAEDLKANAYGAATVAVKATTRPQADGSLALAVDGNAGGLSAGDTKVAEALGKAARFTLAGSVSSSYAVALAAAHVALDALDMDFAGNATPQAVTGTAKIARLDLAAFAPLAGQPLSGLAAANIDIAASEGFAAFSAKLGIRARDAVTGIAALDGFLRGETTIVGDVSRKADGDIAVDGLKIAGKGLDVAVDGSIAKAGADLQAKVAVADLAAVSPDLSGAMSADATFSGSLEKLDVDGKVLIPAGTAMGRKIENLSLAVSATDLLGAAGGTFGLDGRIAGKPATGKGRLVTDADGARHLEGLDILIGSVSTKGDVALANGIATGRLATAAGDLADISALAMTEVAGKLDATLVLDAPGGVQQVALVARGSGIRAAGQALGQVDADATIRDPAGNISVDGRVIVAGMKAGGVTIDKATLAATGAPGATALKLEASGLGMNVTAAGDLSDGPTLKLQALRVTKGATAVTLQEPATLKLTDGGVAVDRLALASGGGSATIAGSAGDRLDLSAEISALPLSIVALFAGSDAPGGMLSGTVKLSGSAAAPAGTYRLSVARLTVPALSASGVGPFDVKAEGALAKGRIEVRGAVTGPSIAGLNVSGSVPMGAGQLALAVKGEIALALANAFLATTGARADGKASLDLAVAGTLAAPSVKGNVRVTGGRYDDPVNGLALSAIEAVLEGSDRAIRLASLSARTADGGTLTGSGDVAIDPAAGFPANITLNLTSATLLSSEVVRMVAGGRVTVTGPVAIRPKIGGRIVVKTLDVNIPDRLDSGLPDVSVRHVNVEGKGGAGKSQAAVQAPAAKAAATRAAPRATSAVDLDVAVSAPNGVFVRGMGLDAELGGDITVRGNNAAPVAIGAFDLRRGRFSVAGKTFTLTSGTITFAGSLDPQLNLVAETTSNGVTAKIVITGPASAPQIALTSSPELPQDEIVSRLFFGRELGSLSAGQALQVAQVVAQFSGGGPGVLDKVRRSLGVDALDVGANAAGNGGEIGIGKRLNDHIYLGVKQGTQPGSSKVTVDVDITKNIRVQGATGADSSEVGIGAQWDY
ncbi:MAG: translocation/assembly module TamB domain-containing protein [Rhizobiales bacterium]|nr:translocation/assembly module TamB domain-containing protein [Hyphomicrobiales bacterium]